MENPSDPKSSIKLKMYYCKYCNYKSLHRSNVTIHARRHTSGDQKTYQCKQCDYTCDVRSNMNRHYKRNHEFWDEYNLVRDLERVKI